MAKQLSGYLIADGRTLARRRSPIRRANATSLGDMERLRGAVKEALLTQRLQKAGIDSSGVRRSDRSCPFELSSERNHRQGTRRIGDDQHHLRRRESRSCFTCRSCYTDRTFCAECWRRRQRVSPRWSSRACRAGNAARGQGARRRRGRSDAAGAVGDHDCADVQAAAADPREVRSAARCRLSFPRFPLDSRLLLLLFFVLGFMFLLVALRGSGSVGELLSRRRSRRSANADPAGRDSDFHQSDSSEPDVSTGAR